MDNIEIFKKWHRGGFATFYNWTWGGKVTIEIAETDSNDKVKSLSKCYIPTLKFLSYLHAEVTGTVGKLYPSLLAPDGDRVKHGITVYGGSPEVSRVFKVEDWNYDPSKNTFEPSSTRRFKAGEFKAKVGAQGAIQPIFSEPISRNSIQMKPEELDELYHHLQLTQQAYETAWMISGQTRKDFNAKVEAKGKERRSQGIYD